jgi:hypothetical protein
MVQGRDVVTATPDVVRDNAEVRASYLGEQIAVEEQVEIVGATSVEGRDA